MEASLLYLAARPREAVADAKDWLLDCYEDEESREEIGLLNAVATMKSVEGLYAGGWRQFCVDSLNLRGENLR